MLDALISFVLFSSSNLIFHVPCFYSDKNCRKIWGIYAGFMEGQFQNYMIQPWPLSGNYLTSLDLLSIPNQICKTINLGTPHLPQHNT